MNTLPYLCVLLSSFSSAQVAPNANCSFAGPYENTHISGYAVGCGTTQFPEGQSALNACCKCPTCTGVVFEPAPKSLYTLRSGESVLYGVEGEMSWEKGDPEDAASCGFEEAIDGYFLSGYACSDTTRHLTVTSAKDACCGCVSCGGVTCNVDGECTIRTGLSGQRASPFGEVSYIKADPSDCLEFSGTFIASPGAVSGGYGTFNITLSPDLESFRIVVESYNLSSAITGIHFHDRIQHLRLLVVCEDDFEGPCDQTFYRGDQNPPFEWDFLIEVLLGGAGGYGTYGAVHTANYPAGELYAQLFCDGLAFQLPDDPCSFIFVCPLEFLTCMYDDVCAIWLGLWSYDMCHLDYGRDTALSTSNDVCWARMGLPLSHSSYEMTEAIWWCVHCMAVP